VRKTYQEQLRPTPTQERERERTRWRCRTRYNNRVRLPRRGDGYTDLPASQAPVRLEPQPTLHPVPTPPAPADPREPFRVAPGLEPSCHDRLGDSLYSTVAHQRAGVTTGTRATGTR